MGVIRRPELATRLMWNEQQERLAAQRVATDQFDFEVTGSDIRGLDRVAGVDLSFFPDARHAVAAVVVLSFPDMEVLFERCATLELEVPYVAGYLAFREVPALAAMLGSVQPGIAPQVVFVDGNGAHHPRRCGAATHLGVAMDLPTVGVAKDVLLVGRLGAKRAEEVIRRELDHLGAWAPFAEDGEEAVAALIKVGELPRKPLVVSPGHRVSLRTAVALVLAARAARGGGPVGVPEPIRQADLRSRRAVQTWLEGSPLPELVLASCGRESPPEDSRKRPRWRVKDSGGEAKRRQLQAMACLSQLRLCATEEPPAEKPRCRVAAREAPAAEAPVPDVRSGGQLKWRPKATPTAPPPAAAEPEPATGARSPEPRHDSAASRECCGLDAGKLPFVLRWLVLG